MIPAHIERARQGIEPAMVKTLAFWLGFDGEQSIPARLLYFVC